MIPLPMCNSQTSPKVGHSEGPEIPTMDGVVQRPPANRQKLSRLAVNFAHAIHAAVMYGFLMWVIHGHKAGYFKRPEDVVQMYKPCEFMQDALEEDKDDYYRPDTFGEPGHYTVGEPGHYTSSRIVNEMCPETVDATLIFFSIALRNLLVATLAAYFILRLGVLTSTRFSVSKWIVAVDLISTSIIFVLQRITTHSRFIDGCRESDECMSVKSGTPRLLHLWFMSMAVVVSLGSLHVTLKSERKERRRQRCNEHAGYTKMHDEDAAGVDPESRDTGKDGEEDEDEWTSDEEEEPILKNEEGGGIKEEDGSAHKTGIFILRQPLVYEVYRHGNKEFFVKTENPSVYYEVNRDTGKTRIVEMKHPLDGLHTSDRNSESN